MATKVSKGLGPGWAVGCRSLSPACKDGCEVVRSTTSGEGRRGLGAVSPSEMVTTSVARACCGEVDS